MVPNVGMRGRVVDKTYLLYGATVIPSGRNGWIVGGGWGGGGGGWGEGRVRV